MGWTYGSAWVGEVIIKEPVLSEAPKCVAEGCWYGIVENDDKTVRSCPKCLGTALKMMQNVIIVTLNTL